MCAHSINLEGRIRFAVLQMSSSDDKSSNLQKATKMVREAARIGADVAVLPELFNFLPRRMTKDLCLKGAEEEKGETVGVIRELSREECIAIVAGSLVEKDGDRIYNTTFVVTEKGIIGKYRKNHLFNYGEVKESEVFTAGTSPLVVDLCGLKTGITICYDLRFPELFRAEALDGAEAIINVAAFLKETGKAHWIPLLRARAIENLVYVIAANQADFSENKSKYYGNSCIISPWGKIVRRARPGEGVVVCSVVNERVKEARERIPVFKQYRKY